ncbi:UDP-glycosyltransferase 85A7 [Linum perenne]
MSPVAAAAVTQQPPHAVCVPFPAQGHINPMLHVAKLLSSRGFHVTFVNTDYNHKRLLKSQGGSLAASMPSGFNFESIPDGLPPSEDFDSTQDIPSLCGSIPENCLAPFRDLLRRLNNDVVLPRVSCIVADASMAFTLDAAKELEIPNALFLTPSACANLAYLNYHHLVEIGMVLKEKEVLAYLSPICPNLLTLGPLNLLGRQVVGDKLENINTNLWTEHSEALQWLDSQEPNSVLYVNFGSITVMTPEQLTEFAWGLANSRKPFLWVIRPDLISDNSAGTLSVPAKFVEQTTGRGLLAGWCNQEQVLKHPSIGGFLSHMGWNSTMESLSNGLPMISWPFFADQQTNCFYACEEWGIGMEIDPDVKREEVEKLVREVMGGGKGKEMKRKVIEWKVKVEEATKPDGSSFKCMEKLIDEKIQDRK